MIWKCFDFWDETYVFTLFSLIWCMFFFPITSNWHTLIFLKMTIPKIRRRSKRHVLEEEIIKLSNLQLHYSHSTCKPFRPLHDQYWAWCSRKHSMLALKCQPLKPLSFKEEKKSHFSISSNFSISTLTLKLEITIFMILYC